MSGKRAKRIMEEARLASLDGSVIKSQEYHRLKKLYIHPQYAPVINWHPTKPGKEIAAKRKKEAQLKQNQ